MIIWNSNKAVLYLRESKTSHKEQAKLLIFTVFTLVLLFAGIAFFTTNFISSIDRVQYALSHFDENSSFAIVGVFTICLSILLPLIEMVRLYRSQKRLTSASVIQSTVVLHIPSVLRSFVFATLFLFSIAVILISTGDQYYGYEMFILLGVGTLFLLLYHSNIRFYLEKLETEAVIKRLNPVFISNIAIISLTILSSLFILEQKYNLTSLVFKDGVESQVVDSSKAMSLENMKKEMTAAFKSGSVKGVRELLDKGFPLDYRNSQGETLLMIAGHHAGEGKTDIVTFLLDKGINVNIPNKKLETALHDAVHFGHVDVVEILIKRGALVNAANHEGKTPLHFAAIHNQPECLEILLKNGADPTLKDKTGKTAVDIAREVDALE